MEFRADRDGQMGLHSRLYHQATHAKVSRHWIELVNQVYIHRAYPWLVQVEVEEC